MMNHVESFSYQLAQTLIVVVIAPLMLGWVNQCRAWLQNRSGAGVLQPYRVLAKLFQKEVILAHGASALFRSSPNGALLMMSKWSCSSGSHRSATRIRPR